MSDKNFCCSSERRREQNVQGGDVGRCRKCGRFYYRHTNYYTVHDWDTGTNVEQVLEVVWRKAITYVIHEEMLG